MRSKILKSSIVVLFVAITSIFLVNINNPKANASTVITSNIPPNILANIDGFDNRGVDNNNNHAPCQQGTGTIFNQMGNSWLFPTGGPSNVDSGNLSSPIMVNAGSTLNLSIVNLSYLCSKAVVSGLPYVLGGQDNDSRPNTINGSYDTVLKGQPLINLTRETEFYFGTPTVPAADGTIDNVVGNNPQTIDFQPGGRWWFPNNQTSTILWHAPATLSSAGTTAITITLPEYVANWFVQPPTNLSDPFAGGGQDTYQCTAPPSFINANTYIWSIVKGNGLSPGCPSSNVYYTLYVKAKVTDKAPPTLTSGATCNYNSTGKGAFTLSPSDSDWGGGFNVPYTITNTTTGKVVGSGTATSGNSYVVDMSGYDQLMAYKINASLADVQSDGSAGGLATATTTYNYGPCYTMSCGSTSMSVNGVPITNQSGPAVGQPFTLTGVMVLTPNNGAPATPTTIGGNMYIVFNGAVVGTSAVGNYVAFNQNFTETLPGVNYPYGNYYIDGPISIPPGAGINITCTGGTKTIGYQPYFSVNGGSIASGSGGFQLANGNDCKTGTNTNSGILAFNSGATSPSPNQGAGNNLAAVASNIINGFQTSVGNSAQPTSALYPNDALSIGNILGVQGGLNPTQDQYYGGGFGTSFSNSCITDYYAKVTSYFPSGPTPNTGSVDITSLKAGVNGCVDEGTAASYTTYCYLSYGGKTGTHNVLCWNSNKGCNPFSPGGQLSNNLVVVLKGDLLIKTNLELNNTANSWTSTKMPSLTVIVSGDVYVDSNVTQLDGTYIVEPRQSGIGGNFYTCTNGYGSWPNAGVGRLYTNCSKAPLTVNGAIVAEQLHLNRTLGSIYANPSTGVKVQPAETFNYEANIWMQNSLSNGDTTPIQPAYQSTTSLPPVL